MVEYRKLLSIIIPTYNNANTLNRCIDSIIRNFSKCLYRIEILVINDGSNDDTLNVINDYNTLKNFKVINQENLGVSIARNVGIKNARGKYVWFIDGDDEVDDFDGEKFLNELLNEDADMFLVGFKKIYNTRNRTKVINVSNGMHIKYNRRDFIRYFNDIFTDNEFNVIWNKLYKVSLLKNNNLYFVPNMKSGEDAAFNCDYLIYCKSMTILPETLVKYSIRNKKDRKYNATYRKDLQILVLKLTMLTSKLQLGPSFLMNNYVEINKGLIDNVFTKYPYMKINLIKLLNEIDQENFKEKIRFHVLNRKNKLKYLLFNTKISIILRYLLVKYMK